MTDEDSASVTSDQLRITVEIGESYELTPRVVAALDELAEALRVVEDQTEVQGYGFEPSKMSFVRGNSYLFDSLGAGTASSSVNVVKMPGPPAPFVPAPLPNI